MAVIAVEEEEEEEEEEAAPAAKEEGPIEPSLLLKGLGDKSGDAGDSAEHVDSGEE